MALWVVDFLRQVRDGAALDEATLQAFVQQAAKGEVPDYQVSAFLMAVYQRGLRPEATRALTLAMRDSGHVISLGEVPGRKVDKHSTGGVGDKISLHLAPWVAACGVYVPMVAGRGLGHTGGTLDKLESIPGLRTALELDDFARIVLEQGACIMGQTSQLAPADRKFYALRDVTATVESIPLITASILAKKLAEGIDALVLDVKVGRGAFMKDEAQARALAESLVEVGRRAGLGVRALLTRMDAPLGLTIGNALEVRECIEVLRGGGPDDVVELTMALGAHMLMLAGRAADEHEARCQLRSARESGAALERFRGMVRAQGGDVDYVDDPSRLPWSQSRTELLAPATGYLTAIDGYRLGHGAVALGAGRSKANEPVDSAVGLQLLHQVGAAVRAGEPVAVVHHNAPVAPRLLADMAAAFSVGPEAPAVQSVVMQVI